jgi:putative endonuclease
MYYVYVLKSLKDGELYKGSTSDLRKRFDRHNTGQVQSTKSRLPLKLVYYEAYSSKSDALKREKFLKTLEGGVSIHRQLDESLKI